MQNIFKALNLKIKYEAVEYFYKFCIEHNKFKNVTPEKDYNGDCSHSFKTLTGFSLDAEIQQDTIGTDINVDMKDFVKQLYYPTKEAWQEYRKFLWQKYMDFIRNIKPEKETYLKCIDAELAKGELSGYAHKSVQYDFYSPLSSVILFAGLAKLDYLEIFKEFILNDNNEVLPGGIPVVVYLKCGCKIPVYQATR
ncbi:MAG: hypothetical protein LBC98_06035 [Prevotellaceae bacterium]|nr:hypothetical protein [Prevotellaceae bacterium]